MPPRHSARSRSTHGSPLSGAKANITACTRCRQKKKRCDQKLPRCRPCEIADVECFGYDIAAKRQVPRSYIQSLEERVAYLESKLRESDNGLRDTTTAQAAAPSPFGPGGTAEASSILNGDLSTNGSASRGTEDDVATVAKATANSILSMGQRRESGLDLNFSVMFLTELMHTKTSARPWRCGSARNDVPDSQISSDVVGRLDSQPFQLPPKEAAQKLVKSYFQFMNIGMPLLHEPTLEGKLDLLYSMPQVINLSETHTSTEARVAVFFVLEVFAVALLSLQKRDPSKIPTWLADRYHKMAVKALIDAGIPSDIEGVQALLLITQYSYLHPTLWDVWRTIGIAMRMAVELGLHQDPRSEDLDFLTLDTMRRTFWVVYAMDRNVSIASGTPLCLSDGAITAKFPSNLDDKYITTEGISTENPQSSVSKRISHHLFRYRRIQSEMRAVLFENHSTPFGPASLDQWQLQMCDRIEEWYKSTPSIENLSSTEKGVIETFELTYHAALFYLYHPSPSIPTPSETQLVAVAQASSSMIQLYRRFFREHKLTIYWRAVENLSSAGTALLYSYVQSRQVQAKIRSQQFESLVHTCSSVLWGMVEHFPVFQGKRDAFDMAASKVLADLSGISSHDRDVNASGRRFTSEVYQLSFSEGVPESQRQSPVVTAGIHDFMRNQPSFDSQPMLGNNFTTASHLQSFSFDDVNDLSLDWDTTGDFNGTFAATWM